MRRFAPAVIILLLTSGLLALLAVFLAIPGAKTAIGYLLGEEMADALTVLSGAIVVGGFVAGAVVALLRWARRTDDGGRHRVSNSGTTFDGNEESDIETIPGDAPK